MSVGSYQNAVERHTNEIAKLQRDRASESAKAASETKTANDAAVSAGRSNQASTVQSKLRDAQRHRERAADHFKKAADIEGKIAREQGRLNDAQKSLVKAQAAEDRDRQKMQERSARATDRTMRAIGGHLVQHDRLHAVALSAIKKLQSLPERITVLFLAADPVDQGRLELGNEARAIHEKLRLSEHRDSVRFETRWAVRPGDLFQALNETRPRIVHFSGHGSDRDEIILQNDNGESKALSKELMAATLAATSGEVQLVFFNACFSQGQAEAVVKHVAAAIGMNDAVGDEAARVFAARFYSGIGFGLSVGLAFRQAKTELMLQGIPEESTPELFVTDGLNADELVLVKPADPAA
ncbi:MAG: hypothetical protein JWO31_4048 [Phycisphaerales bacterium]|nr:hypothetical protein [Phycisphaerales bacterium]